MSGLNKKCEKCFQLHQLDCCGVGEHKEPNCYLHRNNKIDLGFKCIINDDMTIYQLKEITNMIENYTTPNGINSIIENNKVIQIWDDAYLYQNSHKLEYGHYNVDVNFTKTKDIVKIISFSVSLLK